MLGSGRRSASVTTTSPARLLVMFGTEVRRLQEAQPEIQRLEGDPAGYLLARGPFSLSAAR